MKALRVRIALDSARARVWHRDLAEALRRQGHRVTISIRPESSPLPLAASLLLTLERLVYGRSDDAPSASWNLHSQHAVASSDPADVVLDMTGQQSSKMRTLRPVFAGTLQQEAAIGALLDGRI